MNILTVRPYGETDIPPELDGSTGTNRAPTPDLQVPMHNDYEAMGRFLEEYKNSEGTFRMYSREVERFALWAFHVRRKPVSSMSVFDIEMYIDFLADPQPARLWCGPKAPKHTDRWRPFVGPNAANARLVALSAINSMLSYWVQAGYLAGNPMGMFRQLKKKILSGASISNTSAPKKMSNGVKKAAIAVIIEDSEQKVERILDEITMEAVWKAIDHMGQDKADESAQAEAERARFLMSFLYFLAPRAGEIETHTMNTFRETKGMWWWHVVGKGAKAAKVPVPEQMMEALVRYRKHLELKPVPDARDDSPLLRSTRHPGQGMTARRLNQILKDLFAKSIAFLPTGSHAQEERLRAASAHWGRHTSITAKMDSGMNPFFVQSDARHKDFRTTQRYTHVEDAKRHDEAQKVQIKRIAVNSG